MFSCQIIFALKTNSGLVALYLMTLRPPPTVMFPLAAEYSPASVLLSLCVFYFPPKRSYTSLVLKWSLCRVYIFFHFPQINPWFLNTYIHRVWELKVSEAEAFTGTSWEDIASLGLSDLPNTKGLSLAVSSTPFQCSYAASEVFNLKLNNKIKNFLIMGYFKHIPK